MSPDAQALVIPVGPVPPPSANPRLEPRFSFTIVQLNRPHIDREVLPALVARHFGPQGSVDYHVAIVSRQDPGRVIFESESGDAAKLVAHADVKETFFGLGADHFGLMRQAAASLRSSAPPGTPERRLFFSVFGRGPGPQAGPPPRSEEGPRWVLLVRHRAGSLEAAVGRARTRNLAFSFGVLLLMATSVGLLALAARRAQSLARQQIEFVAAVSHELRTPVAVIGAAADNLAQGVVNDPPRVRQYGTTIQGEARRLGETVERVLQFAGIQAGRAVAQRTMVQPEDVVRDAVAASSSIADDAGAQIEVQVPQALPPVVADRGALRSAVQNLVINAIKYGGPRPSVSVSARVAASRRRPEVEIRVSDRGLGIPPSEQARVFEPFYRGAAALSRQIQGNGLGLSIVRSVVDAHGGRVTLQSTPGEGSTFTIHLPVAAAEQSQSLKAVAASSKPQAAS
jgi:signal transduction histidine kinase